MMRGLLTLVVLGMVLAALSFIGLQVYLQLPTMVGETVVEVDAGSSVTRISLQLARAGVIRAPALFVLYARLQQAETRLQVGEYVFTGAVTPRHVLQKLVAGDFRTYDIRIPEGWTMRMIADYLATQPFVRTPDFAAQFLAACRDPARIAALGIEASTLEGFLFPSTYRIPRPHQAGELVDLLTGTFRKQWDAALVQGAAARQMNLLQVVTLASIIEKETGSADERPLVSAVFHNRLQQGMRLETDPTVIYGLPNFDGNLRRADLANSHPYNTYVHPGLPPGPIANPGHASLLAAVQPAAVDYLFFVAKGNGTHEFNRDYNDHVNAVNRYQK